VKTNKYLKSTRLVLNDIHESPANSSRPLTQERVVLLDDMPPSKNAPRVIALDDMPDRPTKLISMDDMPDRPGKLISLDDMPDRDPPKLVSLNDMVPPKPSSLFAGALKQEKQSYLLASKILGLKAS
jgi:hypothetical protein